MPKKNGRRKKKRTHVRPEDPKATSAKAGAQALLAAMHYKPTEPATPQPNAAQNNTAKVPRSFVVRHGKVGTNLQTLVQEFRKVMLPNTALNLRERNKQSIKDYVAVAPSLNVSHIVTIAQKKKGPLLKIARLPAGPTITFRVQSYALSRQIRTTLRKALDPTQSFKTPPLVVLNNLDLNTIERHLKVAALTFQAMFPPLDVQTVRISDCKRVVLFNYDDATEQIEFRQYCIKLVPAKITKSVKRLLKTQVPDLGKAKDISEAVLGNILTGYATSDSEQEDDHVVAVPTKRRTVSSQQRCIKLGEIGPRLSLGLLKIEDQVFTGEVQYHKYMTKTQEEKDSLRQKHTQKAELKQKRKEEQEKNVKRKREEKAKKLELKKQKKAKFANSSKPPETEEKE